MTKIQKVFALKEESQGPKFEIGGDEEDDDDEERGQQLGADQISIDVSSTDGETAQESLGNISTSLKPAFPSFNEPIPI